MCVKLSKILIISENKEKRNIKREIKKQPLKIETNKNEKQTIHFQKWKYINITRNPKLVLFSFSFSFEFGFVNSFVIVDKAFAVQTRAAKVRSIGCYIKTKKNPEIKWGEEKKNSSTNANNNNNNNNSRSNSSTIQSGLIQ